MFKDPKSTSETIKTATEATKNIAEIIQLILQPRGIDAAIEEGHKEIIKDVMASDKYSIEQKEFFLSTYKKRIKEYRNCKKIAEMAFLNIESKENAEKVDPDWFAFFFEKAKLVSDDSMQQIILELIMI